MTLPPSSEPDRLPVRAARTIAILMATMLTACATMDGLMGPTNQRRGSVPATPVGTGAAGRTPTVERPGAPGSPLDYTPTPSRPGAGGSAGARTRSEKQLAEDSENFKNVVFGGFLKAMMTTGVQGGTLCLNRFLPYLNSKNKRSLDRAKDQLLGCGAQVVVDNSIRGASDGYRLAKTQEAARGQLRAVESVTEDMEADNEKLRAMVQTSEEILKESSGRLKQLRDDVSQRKTRADEARRLTEQDRANIANMEKVIADAKQVRDTYQKTAQQMPAGGGKPRELDGEIRKMDQQIATLERQLKQLQGAMVPFAA